MLNIRVGQFETNSSSVHRICIMSNAQYAKWSASDDSDPDNRVYLSSYFDGKTPDNIVFFTEEDVKNQMRENGEPEENINNPKKVKKYAKDCFDAFLPDDDEDDYYDNPGMTDMLQYGDIVVLCFYKEEH